LHLAYIALEILKVAALIALGTLLIASPMKTTPGVRA
jgi:hypothetical protein